MAILQAVLHVNQLNYDQIIIRTDSRSAIKGINSAQSGKPCSRIGLDIEYNIHIKKKRFTIDWITGHFGLQHNEYVYCLTREALNDGNVLEENIYLLMIS